MDHDKPGAAQARKTARRLALTSLPVPQIKGFWGASATLDADGTWHLRSVRLDVSSGRMVFVDLGAGSHDDACPSPGRCQVVEAAYRAHEMDTPDPTLPF